MLFLFVTTARADKIGGSNLPSAKPALKGRIDEDKSWVVVLGSSVGATTNAGPTFDEVPSVFVDRAVGYAGFTITPLGRLDASVNLSDRLYTSYDEAHEVTGDATLTLSRDWSGQQTLLALAISSGRDVEERLRQASLSLNHVWSGARLKPYVKAEAALLDYEDVPGDLYPFTNQDDRDRLSSRVQGGVRIPIDARLEVEVGAGFDTKHYLDQYDDFGVRRDSISTFPLFGFAYTEDAWLLRAVYMPFRRNYREALFQDTWKHGYAVEGEATLTPAIKVFAAARYGFEETDFLIASAAYEAVALGGVTVTFGQATVSLAVSETRRSYEGLDLVDVERDDRKFEVALTGEIPLMDAVALNGRISYLDYKSSFGEVGTDALTVSVGLTYTVAQ